VRKPVRKDAFALDEARVAKRGFFPRSPLVEENHRPSALLQVRGDADPDDAGA